MFNVVRDRFFIFKHKSRLLLPQRVQMYLMAYAQLQLAKRGEDSVILIDKPMGSRILVLAPHPDDEIIGCGGTLHKHYLTGGKITCLYLTSGVGPRGSGRSSAPEKRDLRENDAREGAKIVGIQELVFLRQPASELHPSEEVVSSFAQLLKDLQPDVVYLPFFLEIHPDHFETNRILMLAYSRLSPRIDFHCCAYETSTSSLLYNCVVDIEKFVPIKRLALEQHKTALEDMNIVDATLGLNRHRSLTTLRRGSGYGEAFLYLAADDYFALLQKSMESTFSSTVAK